MVENKKKRTLTISTSFDKKKLVEPSLRPGEKKVYIPEKKKTTRNFQNNKNFTNPGSQKTVINKKNFARKFAEQQATKRFIQPDHKKSEKNKEKPFDKKFSQRREHKLTISRAMDVEEFEIKQRSLASVKRARLKEKKNLNTGDDAKKGFKKVIRDVKIPKQITIQELSNRMAEQSSNIIKFLLKYGS